MRAQYLLYTSILAIAITRSRYVLIFATRFACHICSQWYAVPSGRYGDMQLIAESYDILKQIAGLR